jgi:hypothetical protein
VVDAVTAENRHLMVCVRGGRPIAVFSDPHAGDAWLNAHMHEVELVYQLVDNHPPRAAADGERPPEFLIQHASSDGINDVAAWRVSDEVGQVLLHAPRELIEIVRQLVEIWQRLPAEDQIPLVRRLLEVAQQWPQ